MKNLVVKVPTFVFAILLLIPLLLFACRAITDEVIVEMSTLKILFGISSAVKLIWLFSIVDYFQSKLDHFKFLKLIYFLLTVDGLISFWCFFSVENPDVITEIVYSLLPIVVHIVTTVFITLLVQKVFYERAVWFIALEVFTLVVGIITLTPEIKRNEKELSK